MNFQIEEKTIEGLELIEIQNQLSGEYVNIIPGYGGAINEVVLNRRGKLHSIHKFAKSLQEFQEVSIPLFAGAFLAPFPNRIKNGFYDFNGIEYQLELTDIGLPNALHGFLYNAPFTVSSSQKESGILILEHHFKGDKGYPFDLFFRNTYQLLKGGLKISSFVRNDSNKMAPFGMGWHPYISTGTCIDLFHLKIPSNKNFEQNDQYIPTGRILEKTKFRAGHIISDEFMNDCYRLENDNRTIVYDPEKDIEIFIEQQIGEKAYNYAMYYSPPSRDCLAIEPMTSAPDAFNNGHGLMVLKPEETMDLEFSFGINEL